VTRTTLHKQLLFPHYLVFCQNATCTEKIEKVRNSHSCEEEKSKALTKSRSTFKVQALPTA